MDTTPERQALHRAVGLAGGQAGLARRLSEITGRQIKQPHVWNWLYRDSAVPAEMVIPIERATTGAVTRHELRPDLYPPEGEMIAGERAQLRLGRDFGIK